MVAASISFTGDLRLEAGATFDVTLTILKPNGQPFDFTDFTESGAQGLRGKFRENDGTLVFNFAQGTGIPSDNGLGAEILDPPQAGRIRIQIDAVATALAQTNNQLSGKYDIEAVSAEDTAAFRRVVRVIEGTWVVTTEQSYT